MPAPVAKQPLRIISRHPRPPPLRITALPTRRLVDHADVIDPDGCRAALGDKTLCAPSQSSVAALKSRAVIFVLADSDSRLARPLSS